MKTFVNGVGAVSKACGVMASLLLASAIVVVCQMVLFRYVLNKSTFWQTDYVTFALVGATLIGSPYVLLIKGHVNVDLLPHYLPRRGRVVLAWIACLGGLAFALVLAWSGWILFHDAWAGQWRTATVWELPLWIPYLSLPLGCGLLALQYVADIIALATGRDMPFAAGGYGSSGGD